MIVTFPIGPDGIHRAAERMLQDYGPEAWVRARRRTQRLEAQELDALAEIWDLIAAVIRDLEETRRRTRGPDHTGADWLS